MPEADRRLHEVAQLRKLWRAFRDPQERLDDERLARAIVRDRSTLSRVQEPIAVYGSPVVRAVIRHWWCTGQYAAIVELGERLESSVLEEEPLLRVYTEAAKARLTGPATR
jgi:hypothetical protein